MNGRTILTSMITLACAGLVIGTWGCSSAPKIAVRPNEHMEIGWTPRTIFQSPSYAAWYDTGYQRYQPDPEILGRLRKMEDSVSLVTVYGTWCGDSKREMPRFLKILDSISFPAERLTLIAVDRTMQLPAGIKERYQITNVPTIMVVYRGVEIYRIIESPKGSLEGDLKDALSPFFPIE
jgi:thiol-disulfide isomerase/thioredoxin